MSAAAEWLAAVGTIGAVLVALWLARREGEVRRAEQDERQARDAYLEAGQVVINQSPPQEDEYVPPITSQKVLIHNYGASVIRKVVIEADWRTRQAADLRQQPNGRAQGTLSIVELHHLAPHTEDGLVWVGYLEEGDDYSHEARAWISAGVIVEWDTATGLGGGPRPKGDLSECPSCSPRCQGDGCGEASLVD